MAHSARDRAKGRRCHALVCRHSRTRRGEFRLLTLRASTLSDTRIRHAQTAPRLLHSPPQSLRRDGVYLGLRDVARHQRDHRRARIERIPILQEEGVAPVVLRFATQGKRTSEVRTGVGEARKAAPCAERRREAEASLRGALRHARILARRARAHVLLRASRCNCACRRIVSMLMTLASISRHVDLSSLRAQRQ
jgi:hypothetical protein